MSNKWSRRILLWSAGITAVLIFSGIELYRYIKFKDAILQSKSKLIDFQASLIDYQYAPGGGQKGVMEALNRLEHSKAKENLEPLIHRLTLPHSNHDRLLQEIHLIIYSIRKDVMDQTTAAFQELQQQEIIGKSLVFLFLVGLLMTIKWEMQEKQRQKARLLNTMKLTALGEMAGGMAHEIYNPLAIIQGRCDQLLNQLDDREGDSQQMRKNVLKIIKTSERIQEVIKGLQDFSSETVADTLQERDLKEIVHTSLALCQNRLKMQGILLSIDQIPDLLLPGQYKRLSQVLVNLIQNAEDAILNQETPWIKISFEYSLSGHSLFIKVSDSGSGVPVKFRHKIMDPFFSTKDNPARSGLGLSVSQGIVRSLGGNLWFDSEATHTTFVIEIPKPLQELAA